MNQNVILAYGPNLKLTTVKGTHVYSLYAKNEANKNIRFFIIKIKEKYTSVVLPFTLCNLDENLMPFQIKKTTI